MLSINLLPREEKQAYEREVRARIGTFFAFWTSAVLGVGIVFLLPSFLPLVFQRWELERAIAIIERFSAAAALPSDAPGDLRLSEFIQTAQSAGQQERTTRLSDAAFHPSPGITIGSLLIEGKNIAITGRAETRADLLLFEQSLKNSELFENISSPLSNIIQERDAGFSISAAIRSAKKK
ncbi:MAG: hypothetical protein HY472_01200 [Candidatus Sungbacteria bacterium]|nr:hypothetical protein [Candidatus Sungbacteria bacterium]